MHRSFRLVTAPEHKGVSNKAYPYVCDNNTEHTEYCKTTPRPFSTKTDGKGLFCFGFKTDVCSVCSHSSELFPCLDVLWLQIFPWHACLGDPHAIDELQVCRFKRLCLDPTCHAAKTCCAIPTFYRHSIQKCMSRNLPYAQKLPARHSTGTQRFRQS
jgi:hypothetical protein